MKHVIHFAILGAGVLFAEAATAQDPAGLKELNSNFSKGMELRNKNKHAESIPFFEKAAALAPQVFGQQHLNTASIHRTAGAANYHAQRYAAAEKYYRVCLEIREAKLPKNDLQLAAALSDLGITLHSVAKYKEAETLLTRALGIYEAKFPKDHIETVATVINLGNLYHATGRYVEAANFFERSLHIMQKYRGKDHVEPTDQMHNLAETYRAMGRFQESEALARRAMAIREAKLGKDHVLIADNLNTIGLIEHALGRFKDAERHLTIALAMREKAHGKDSLPVATALANIAIVFGHTDRLDEAEIYLRRALAIRERKLGPDHPSVAVVLNTMGVFASSLGRREEGVKLLKRSLAIQEAKFGMNHPGLNDTLSSLAAADLTVANYKSAEQYCLRGLKILEESLGADHPDNLGPLNNLAIAYLHTDRPEEARAMLMRVLQIREKRLGKNHPNTSLTYSNLGAVCFRTRDYAKAEEYYLSALQIAETTVGKKGGELTHILPGLVNVYEATNRMDKARQTLDRCLSIYHVRLNNMFGFSSEAALFDYIEANSPMLLSLMCLALQEQKDAKMAEESLTWLLRLRGTVFDSMCQYRQAQLMLGDAELEKLVTRYRSQKAFVANAAVNPPLGVSADKLKQQVADAEQEVAELERDIRRTLTRKAPSVFAARESVTAQQVRDQLPMDGALIEFSNMPVRSFKRGTWSAKYHYLAIIQPRSGPAKVVDLGVAKDIDNGVEELRKEFIDFQEKLRDCETPEEMKTLEQKQEKQFVKKSAGLHARLFAPLRPHLGKATQLYLVCDASLNRLPFESLVDADGKYLIESYRCVYLSSGRDLLRAPTAKAKGTVVFAGPDYKLDADERLAQVEQILQKKNTLVASRSLPGRELRSAGWKNLPGAAAEAKDIQQIVGKGSYGPVKAYVGPQALEEVLKAMPAPRVLHLATHGFFLDREPDAEPPPEDGAGAGWARGRLKRAGNPLLRSGIVLAGANTVGDKDSTARVDDGWVTAEEIALLNLQGTELVVLSACQTGLGDIKSGEGVYGLRRAFLYAGARSLVTSLFEVPDTETRELMRRFYTGLNAGQGKLRALHSAQRSFIDDRRKMQGAAHPFFWSSFILVGDAD